MTENVSARPRVGYGTWDFKVPHDDMSAYPDARWGYNNLNAAMKPIMHRMVEGVLLMCVDEDTPQWKPSIPVDKLSEMRSAIWVRLPDSSEDAVKKFREMTESGLSTNQVIRMINDELFESRVQPPGVEAVIRVYQGDEAAMQSREQSDAYLRSHLCVQYPATDTVVGAGGIKSGEAFGTPAVEEGRKISIRYGACLDAMTLNLLRSSAERHDVGLLDHGDTIVWLVDDYLRRFANDSAEPQDLDPKTLRWVAEEYEREANNDARIAYNSTSNSDKEILIKSKAMRMRNASELRYWAELVDGKITKSLINNGEDVSSLFASSNINSMNAEDCRQTMGLLKLNRQKLSEKVRKFPVIIEWCNFRRVVTTPESISRLISDLDSGLQLYDMAESSRKGARDE